jgi:hypothetical protein
LMKEVHMSKTKSISVLAARLAVLALACVLTFTLAAAPQMVADGPGVTVDTGGAMLPPRQHRLSRRRRAKRVQAWSSWKPSSRYHRKRVGYTRVISGPIELRRAAQHPSCNGTSPWTIP